MSFGFSEIGASGGVGKGGSPDVTSASDGETNGILSSFYYRRTRVF